MTDEQLDRMLREADPFRPAVVRRLDGAQQNLLEEILSQPPREDEAEIVEVGGGRPRSRAKWLRRGGIAIAAAAALTVVIAVPLFLRHQHATDRTGPVSAASAAAPGGGANAGAGAQVALEPVLAGVPLPPGFDATHAGDPGASPENQYGRLVIGRVGCAWMDEWKRAKAAGDTSALQRAAAALRDSHNWAVLKELSAEGGYADVFWEEADRTVAGDPDPGYKTALGCG